MLATIICAALASTLIGVRAAEVTIGADALTSYIWRGITINKERVVQPYVNVEHPAGFSLEIWTNMNLQEDDGRFGKRAFSETRFTMAYEKEVNDIAMSIGYTEYTYTGQDKPANDPLRTRSALREIFAGARTELLPGLQQE